MGVLKVTEHLSFRQACLAGGGGCAGMQLLDAAELERRAQVPPDGGTLPSFRPAVDRSFYPAQGIPVSLACKESRLGRGMTRVAAPLGYPMANFEKATEYDREPGINWLRCNAE
jgi:hypothetical protein